MENPQENLENQQSIENDEGTTQHSPENENNTTDTSEENPLQNQLNEVNDKYLRLVAEFDNYRKRVAREKLDLIKNASEDLIISLLETLDDYDRASDQLEKSTDIESIKEGIHLIFSKFKKTLENKGLTEMSTVNEDFNVDLHEALTEIPAPTEEMKGKVIDQITKGYKLNDKVIRHAKVVVGK